MSSRSQALADLERYTTLKERGYAPIAQFDLKKAANDEAEGRLARAQRSFDLARNQFGYADLKADADGVITATLAEPGQVVAIGQAVARLAHRGEKEAVIALPETWLDEARQAKATVRLWSGGDRRFQAKLRELSPQADSATRTYAARFTMRDADDTVAFGMTATVTLERAREMPTAKLPLAAILNRGNGPSVYVVDNGGACAPARHSSSVYRGRRVGDVRRQGRRQRCHARCPETRCGPQGPADHSPQLASRSVGATS